jgi:long-chain acyl-CoA synthetase
VIRGHRRLPADRGPQEELIISFVGKNMSSTNIEDKLKAASHLIGYADAIDDGEEEQRRPDCARPRRVGRLRQGSRHGRRIAGDPGDRAGVAHIAAAVETVNEQLSRVERIKKFTILRVDRLPERDDLTPTMKLKR